MSAPKAIQVFKTITDNPIMRRLLRNLSKYCTTCNKNRLEVALELYVKVREDACDGCKRAEKVVSRVIKAGSKTFGATQDEMMERFKDSYWRRGLASVVKGIGMFGIKKPFVPGAPFQVVWNITKACNLKCKHCYESAGKIGEDEVSTEEAILGIDKLAKACVTSIAFSGGEPTIRPDILKLIEHANDRGIYVAMATNATTFSNIERVKEFKKAGLQFAQISLDGLNPDTHDTFRGVPGTYAKTIEGIKNCVAEKLFVEVAMVGTRYNYKEIPQMVDLCDSLGVDWFMLYNFIPTGRGVEIMDTDLSPEQREEVLRKLWLRMKTSKTQILSTAPQYARIALEVEDELASKIRTGEKVVCDGVVIPTHFYNTPLVGELTKLADFIGGCGCGRFYVAIEPNGDIYPCVFFPHNEDVRVGNIIKDDFDEIWWKSDLLKKTRDKDLLENECKNCKYRYICGGCRARAYNYFGNVLAPDPGCIRNKASWIRIEQEQEQKIKRN